MGDISIKVLFIYDQNFNRLQYRGLNFFTEFKSFSWYNCSRDCSSCINSEGEDLSTNYNQLLPIKNNQSLRIINT